MRKGGENLNGSSEEKGSPKEGDQEEVVVTLSGFGGRIDPDGPK